MKKTRRYLAAVGVVLVAGCAHAPSSEPGPAEPIPLTAGGPGIRHRVEPGQTLYRIAKAYGLTVQDLMEANHLSDARLAVGQEILIPRAVHSMDVPPPAVGALTPAPGSDSPPPPAVRPSEDPDEPIATHLPKFPQHPPAHLGVLQWPLKGVLYARFGKKGREPHDGIDLAAPAGTPVMTAAEGTVLFAGEQHGYGRIAIVEHENGLITLYAHNRDLRVKTGQRVRPGQVVATVGDTGRTSGPHLHFEVRKDGVPVDPLDYLAPAPIRSR